MKLQCTTQLPASKSESNRALMIAAYGGFAPVFQNLSDSKDTMVLKEALRGLSPIDSLSPTCHGGNDIGANPQIDNISDTIVLKEALRGLSPIDSLSPTCHGGKCSAFDVVNDIGANPQIDNISDTIVLKEALRGLSPIDSLSPTCQGGKCSAFDVVNDIGANPRIINISDCGTAARFMTTYLATHEGNWLLTASQRMRQRPMAPLVETLLSLGAEIQYAEKRGFLPLQIRGKSILGGKVTMVMSQSSQFASSLLLAAPMWPQGLEMELLGDLNSFPYLDMTLAMMRHFGAEVELKDRTITVRPKPYQTNGFMVSSDWSAASYWYEMAAFSEDCEIRLPSLSIRSLSIVESAKDRRGVQGDSIIAEWMNPLGVMSVEENDSIVLCKKAIDKQDYAFDFSYNPDLFPTMAATCAGLQLEARFTGIATLENKESDRILAMKMELAKIGTILERVSDNELVLRPSSNLPFFGPSAPLQFNAYGDHRIVMALAPLSMKVGTITFDHPEVVAKSYPNYWKECPFIRVLL